MVFPDLQHVAFADKLCSVVLADHRGLPRSLTSSRWTKEPAMVSYQHEECVQLAIGSIT